MSFFKNNTKLRERRKAMERMKGRRLVWEQLMRLYRALPLQRERHRGVPSSGAQKALFKLKVF